MNLKIKGPSYSARLALCQPKTSKATWLQKENEEKVVCSLIGDSQ
jgi:hypothetical protein